MEAYRVESEIGADGKLVLAGLPFPPGKRLEIILLPAAIAPDAKRYPLRGEPIEYDDPFSPACPPEDWDVFK